MTEEMLLATIRNQKLEIERLQVCDQQRLAILALSKEANQVIVAALQFYGHDQGVAQAALAKYEEIKRRAADVIKPL